MSGTVGNFTVSHLIDRAGRRPLTVPTAVIVLCGLSSPCTSPDRSPL